MSDLLIMHQELSSIVAKRLREMIIEKGMQPGDRLPTENELVSMFGVSRSTVREAVKLLTAENVVQIMRGRGTFISEHPGLSKDPLGLEFTNQAKLLDNLLEVRMMIEPQIAYLAAQRAKPKNIERLETIIKKIQQAGSNKADHTLFDISFHAAVAECTQNDVLHRILPIICESIQQGYFITAYVPGSYERAIISHTKIYQAIMVKDSKTAKNETEIHLRQTIEDLNYFGGKKQ